MDKIANALDYAVKKHGDQKYGSRPYVYHLTQVLQITTNMKLSEEHRITALLHDVLEDTQTTFDELENVFGEDIAENVYSLTRQIGEEYEDYLERLSYNNVAREIKICDLLANLKECAIDKSHSKLLAKYQKAIFLLATEYI